jgi:serine/threonine-protein kinase RIM15
MEFKLPQINGEDVARMIRTSKNPNSSTPIVAVTGYLKDLSDPQHFDELIEKPATPLKLIDVLERQCFWKPPPAERLAFGERKELLTAHKSTLLPEDSGRMSPSVERFMASARARTAVQFSSADDDTLSVSSSSTGTVPVTRSTTAEWASNVSSEHASLDGRRNLTVPAAPSSGEAPTKLQPPSQESRVPSPLSTHVTSDNLDNVSSPLPSPPGMIPLPPSITSTPVFGTPVGELHKSPLSRSNSPPAVPLQRFRTHPPVGIPSDRDMEQRYAKKGPQREEKSRSPFSMLFSSSKDRDLSDPDEQQPTSPPLDLKNKKRSSMEKKKEKHGKQRREGLLGEEADADDEDSITGGKKPNKSRSIGEMIRGAKWSPPEMKRTRSGEEKI